MELRDRLLECIKHYYEDYFCFDAVYYKWCARYDIKDTTLFILERIYTAPERCTQKYLCETLSYPKQTISASLKQLEARGFITRRKDPEDFRGNLIAFTPGMLAIVCVFLLAGLFSLVLAQVFDRAVSYKQDNDLTI